MDERIRKIYGRSNPTQHLMKQLIRGLFRWLSPLWRTLRSNENAEKGRQTPISKSVCSPRALSERLRKQSLSVNGH
ncbi:MAG: hypothetical protein E6K92_09460 [Thaumarchaeota archaeon]|nr:MAG: hypothetical protein E6K92_09460 [Nitrososphaerota archaeon]